ncbi:MAG: lipid-binding SYLF domain-containing protein [Acidobacteria bacterium]|nr:lipid-binding SYLF domain-containing protein [Acidobacteriota bacterium]
MPHQKITGYLAAILIAVPLALSGSAPGPLPAGEQSPAAAQVKKVEDAIRVLEEMMKESDNSIPIGLIEDCSGLAIIPDVIKAGLVIGGRHGKGVLLVRTKGGGWSDPSFIDIKGGSIGWQVGVESADVILVFRTPRSIENITQGKFTLGANAGVAAGPLGRSAEASTDSDLKAEILAYSRSRGLYAGLTLQGSSIQEDRKANLDFYGTESVSPQAIFEGKVTAVPEIAAKLKSALAELVKR